MKQKNLDEYSTVYEFHGFKIKIDFGSDSFIYERFDVGIIAKNHSGNGHAPAASVNITEEQKEYALKLRKRSNRESLEYLVNCSYK